MKRRRLGRTGLVVSEICMGTMTFGNQADEKTSLAILDRAWDAGVDFIDAAEVYPVPPNPKYAGRTDPFFICRTNSRIIRSSWVGRSTTFSSGPGTAR